MSLGLEIFLKEILKHEFLWNIGWSSSTERFGKKTRKHLESVGKFETRSWEIKDSSGEIVSKSSKEAGKNEIFFF